MTKSQRAEMIDKMVEASEIGLTFGSLNCLDDAELRRSARSLGIWLVIRPSPAIENQSNASASDGLQ